MTWERLYSAARLPRVCRARARDRFNGCEHVLVQGDGSLQFHTTIILHAAGALAVRQSRCPCSQFARSRRVSNSPRIASADCAFGLGMSTVPLTLSLNRSKAARAC